MSTALPKEGIIKVGGGRGFVVQGDRECRYVVTAAHCLQRAGEPYIPPAIGGISYTHERTYANLLGPIGGEQTVWAECLFVDPIADLAVLGTPDNQELYEEAEDYAALTGAAALPIVEVPLIRERITSVSPLDGDTFTFLGPPKGECAAWLLSLEGRWFRADVTAHLRTLAIANPAEAIASGMSGSPIVTEDGSAIGIVCNSSGPNPNLAANLPPWLLRSIGLLGG
jgi:hypothetical protein